MKTQKNSNSQLNKQYNPYRSGKGYFNNNYAKSNENKQMSAISHSNVQSNDKKLFDDAEKSHVLSMFPQIEPSYETLVHKNVPAMYISLIPVGIKCYAWFTTYRSQNVCLLLKMHPRNKDIVSVEYAQTGFHDSLCVGENGTILYGTLFHYEHRPFFTIEDIMYHKDERVQLGHKGKLALYKTLLSGLLGSNAIHCHCIIFGLPIMHTDFDEIQRIALAPTSYKVWKYQFYIDTHDRVCSLQYNRNINNNIYSNNATGQNTHSKLSNAYANTREQPQSKSATQSHMQPSLQHKAQPLTKAIKPARTAVFKVIPDIQPDVYYLLTREYSKETKTSKEEQYDTAYIPNYTVSSMMNKLFRNIKENDNLDALEESDDEEEFENADACKYVRLNVSYNMRCEYNYKFKKWAPVAIANAGEHVTSKYHIRI